MTIDGKVKDQKPVQIPTSERSESAERERILLHWSNSLAFLQGDASSDVIFKGIRYGKDRSKENKIYDTMANVAVIPIEGTLYQKSFASWFFGEFEGYDNILLKCAEALKDDKVDSLLLNIDSHGGEVAGLFDTCLAIKNAGKAFDKPIVAFVNECATSAAFALASVADEIIVPKTGRVGSIGVVTTHADQSAALDRYGIKLTVIASGKAKADGHPGLPLSAEAKARIQEQVNQLFDIFAEWVSQSRKLTIGSIAEMEAQTFIGQRAIDFGLADRLGTIGDSIYTASRLGKKRRERRNMATLLEGIINLFSLDSTLDESKALDKLQEFKTQSDNMAKSLEENRSELDKKEREKIIAQGEALNKVTKAQKDNVFPLLTTEQLRVTIANASPVIPRSSNEETKTTSELSYKGKTWDQMTSMDRDNLYRTDQALYQRMKNPERG